MILAVVVGLCLAILLLRLHLKRKEAAAADTAAQQDALAEGDYVLPPEPTRSSLTER